MILYIYQLFNLTEKKLANVLWLCPRTDSNRGNSQYCVTKKISALIIHHKTSTILYVPYTYVMTLNVFTLT